MRSPDIMLCPCKVNLRLKVTKRRPDGYHELKSTFLPLAFPFDELSFREGEAGIRFTSPAFPGSSDNLVTLAAALYAETSGIAPAWEFFLEKRIPIAAGLGGGSSDAAAALTLLNRRYGAFSAEELAALACRLGADVPFFLAGRPAVARGIGEKLSFLPDDIVFPEVLIVFPGFPVSAKFAYRNLSPELIGADDPGTDELFFAAAAAGDPELWKRFVRNDLAYALQAKFPLLSLLKEALLSAGAMAAEVSGSGSSCFALFSTLPEAERAADALRASSLCSPVTRIFTGGKER